MRILGLPIPFTGEPQGAQLAAIRRQPRLVSDHPRAVSRRLAAGPGDHHRHRGVVSCRLRLQDTDRRDIAKLRIKLAEKDANDIWSETTNPAYSPVLRRPNDYQTRNQFWESWVLSKLSRGNTYVLKVRDNRNVVTALHILDPTRVQPLVSDDGTVFYRAQSATTSPASAR